MDPQEQVKPDAGAACLRPWLASTLCLAALLVYFLPPGAASWLTLDREALRHGQFWRLWTGHWVHFGAAHLLWNLLAAGVAAAWLETLHRRLLIVFLLLAPPAVGAALLLCCPAMTSYGGLSALAVGLAAALCVCKLRHRASPAWALVLLLLAAKILVEFKSGGSLLGLFGSGPIRSMPEAHAAGFAFGALISLTLRTDRPCR